MNWTDWYTDLVDIYRVESKTVGALTKQERVRVAADIPCRIYRSPAHSPKFSSPAAYSEEEDKLACDNQVDVQAGDELVIRRGGRLGRKGPEIRAFAGEPARFYEPFGAVIPGLAHQELALYQKEYLQGAVTDVG